MYLLVESRKRAAEEWAGAFAEFGVATERTPSDELEDWVAGVTERDKKSIEGVVLGPEAPVTRELVLACERLGAPIICLRYPGEITLETTLRALDCRVDDVLPDTVYAQEIMARTAAIRRRIDARATPYVDVGAMRVYFDGRHPTVSGQAIHFTRRELAILACLARHLGMMVPVESLMGAMYGINEDRAEDKIVQVFMCKLRRKLTPLLGYNPIATVWGQGYKLVQPVTCEGDYTD